MPSLDGEVELGVPAGTQDQDVIRLRGKGIPHIKGYGRGDQLCVMQVKIPKRLNKRQRELMVEFATIEEGKKATRSANSGTSSKASPRANKKRTPRTASFIDSAYRKFTEFRLPWRSACLPSS
ncbi:MAG: hypothetical protein M5R36_30010 [Deltaproteobacteria bacterium]|nr:hypothetical protein [Deltaproteobacteria bacterium]